MEEKNLQLERLVFFSDAVVAIAITLLALDIKIDHTESGHLHFSDILGHWKTIAAFFLSFFNIANFWRTHHAFFAYIKKINEKILWFNIIWLLFIVLLPFSTSLVSNYFFDKAAMFTYSFTTFLIAIFQNMIWDYASDHKMIDEHTDPEFDKRIRSFCNLDMLNAVLGVLSSLISPLLAFIILFTKFPVILIVGVFHRRKKRLAKPKMES